MTYVCPMHPEVTSHKKGTCPKCHMDLVPEHEAAMQHADGMSGSYRPLIVIVLLILLVSSVLSVQDYATNTFSVMRSMSYFMAGFFLVFSGFKFMDLKGFAEGYATYDLIAKRWYGYGYVYPFIELILGLAYTLDITTPFVLWATLIVMAIGGVGVYIEVQKGRTIRCSCLGTFLNVPLSTVTIIEDFGMVAMSAAMLLLQ